MKKDKNKKSKRDFSKWHRFCGSDDVPPKGVPLMCEIFHKDDKELSHPMYRLCGFYDSEGLRFPYGKVYEKEDIGEILYRLWE